MVMTMSVTMGVPMSVTMTVTGVIVVAVTMSHIAIGAAFCRAIKRPNYVTY